VRKVSPREWVALQKISAMDSVYRSYGVHASGVLLSGDNVLIEDYIPTMLVASSNTTVTQFDMDDVEEFGLLKMDLLGQTSLTVMRICQELIGRDDPTDFTWMPEDDADALRLLRTGRTDTGLFHFEGYTKSKGGKELGVRNINDAILVQALYMPGCMDIAPGQSISMKDLYLKRKKNTREREKVTYLHDAFKQALAPTYGCVVYQEQVIQIMRNLGMDIAGINKFFKVVKDSGRGATARNLKRLEEVREQFNDLCDKAGIDPDEAWSQTASFVAYGFNKNHATGYGIRSYRTAYLKAHYPLEYMTALLQAWAGRDKEKVYVREVRRMEIPLLAPDVNISTATWTMDAKRGAIRRGLVSIAGIGEKTADEIEKHRPYKSLDDFARKVNGRTVTGVKGFLSGETKHPSGMFGKLEAAGVFDSISE
jgi:DNA polymerase III subunit alpha